MSPRSDRALTWAGVGWFFRALGWCLLAPVFPDAERHAENAMRHAEACLERRAKAKHVR